METLETERLLLRHFEARDADDIYRSVYSDPEVCKYYCGGQTHSRESMGDWIIYRAHQSRGNDFGLLAIEVKKLGRVIGLCGLQAYVADWLRMESEAQRVDHPLEVELTYALGREFWGKGYASEACRAVIGFAFEELKLRRLVTGCEPENLLAMRLQERLGMRRERNVLGKFCAVVGVMDNPLFVQGPG